MSTPDEARAFLESYGITQTYAEHLRTAGPNLGGIDYGVPHGTLLPRLDGVLEYGPGSGLAWYNAGLGKAVAYRRPDGTRTVFAHNSKVDGGDVYSGNSGTVRPKPSRAFPYAGSHVHAHDVEADGKTRRPPFSLAGGGSGGGGQPIDIIYQEEDEMSIRVIEEAKSDGTGEVALIWPLFEKGYLLAKAGTPNALAWKRIYSPRLDGTPHARLATADYVAAVAAAAAERAGYLAGSSALH